MIDFLKIRVDESHRRVVIYTVVARKQPIFSVTSSNSFRGESLDFLHHFQLISTSPSSLLLQLHLHFPPSSCIFSVLSWVSRHSVGLFCVDLLFIPGPPTTVAPAPDQLRFLCIHQVHRSGPRNTSGQPIESAAHTIAFVVQIVF